MKISKTSILAGWVMATCAVGASSVFAADADKAVQEKPTRETQESKWYVQGLVGQAYSSDQDVSIRLGGPVVLNGTATYGNGPAFSIAVGKQWLGSKKRDENDAADKPATERCPQADHEVSEAEPKRRSAKDDDCLPWRSEVEIWNGSAKRESITVGALNVKPGDTVHATAFFFNGAFRLLESDELKANLLPTWRTWLAAGVGYARINTPSATLISGCNCLAAVNDSGLAMQLKLMVERQVSDSTLLVLQAGHIWLPKVQTPDAQLPQTQWQGRGVNQLMVGLRHLFK